MRELNNQEIYQAFDRALQEVQRRFAAGQLDMSGRYYSDEELREMAKTWGKKVKPDAA